MSFSARFSEVINGSGLSQGAIATKLGVTQQAVGHWAKGITKPTELNIGRICREFGLRRDWLLYGEGDRELGSYRVKEEADYGRKQRVQRTVEVVLENSSADQLQLFEGIVKTFGRHVSDQKEIKRFERDQLTGAEPEKEKKK